MKINRFFALVLIALLVISVMGMATYRASAQPPPTNGDDTSEVGDTDAGEINEGPDVSITGTALEQASAAALDYIGEGRVTDTEVGDEEGYYEVEISMDNGREVDVHLDEAFNVLGHKND